MRKPAKGKRPVRYGAKQREQIPYAQLTGVGATSPAMKDSLA